MTKKLTEWVASSTNSIIIEGRRGSKDKTKMAKGQGVFSQL